MPTAEKTDQDTQLLEYASSRGLSLRVDRERGVISGVKILGLESANGRSYQPQAMADAAKLYEGRPVNVDHVEGQRRSYRDRIGRLTKIELRGDGLYGDLLVNPKHPLTEQLLWDAEHAPENVGLSHDAQGRTIARAGKVIVESIKSVRSVDLVAEPATTKGLFESKSAGGAATAETDEDDDAGPADDVDKLPDDAFALILPGGVKIGKRTHPLHKRHFPIHNAGAVKRSLARIEDNRKLAPNHREHALRKAAEAARRFGIPYVTKSNSHKESREMKLEELTLEQLKEARPDLVSSLQTAGETEAEVVKLKEERDKLAAEIAAGKRREKIAVELKEAKIDAEKVPASLMEAIQSANDEPRKKLIEDLKGLLEGQSAGDKKSPVQSSRSSGTPLPATFEERSAAWNS